MLETIYFTFNQLERQIKDLSDNANSFVDHETIGRVWSQGVILLELLLKEHKLSLADYMNFYDEWYNYYQEKSDIAYNKAMQY